jgi:hypothetical protein
VIRAEFYVKITPFWISFFQYFDLNEEWMFILIVFTVSPYILLARFWH